MRLGTAVRGPLQAAIRILGPAILLLALAFATVGPIIAGPDVAAPARASAATPSGLDNTRTFPVGDPRPSGARELPILAPGGIADVAVGAYRSGGGREFLNSAINDVGTQLGLGSVLGDLYALVVGDSEFLATLGTGEVAEGLNEDIVPTYPYTYPELDSIIDEHLDATVVAAQPDLASDLASLLVFSESQRAYTDTDPADRIGTAEAALGYSVLRRAAEINETCDIAVGLELITALGLNAPIDLVTELADNAVGLCPDDPTPTWLLAQTAAEQASATSSLLATNHTPGDLVAIADANFATLTADYPELPLGLAGRADLRLKLADELEDIGASPFTVLAYRRQALSWYIEARGGSDDPALLPGYARALSGLGEHEQALGALADARAADPKVAAYLVMQVNELFAAKKYTEAAEAALEISTVTLPGARQVLPGQARESPTYGGYETVRISVGDPTGTGSGGSDVSDYSFIPVSRFQWETGGCLGRTRQLAQILAGDSPDLVDDVEAGNAYVGVDPYRDCDFMLSSVDANRTDENVETALAETGDLEGWTDQIRSGYSDDTDDDFMADGFTSAWDRRQDLWRWAGDLDHALEVTGQWREAAPEDPFGAVRRGEVLFLQGEHEEAADAFGEALPLFDALIDEGGVRAERYSYYGNGSNSFPLATHRQWAVLQEGAALERAGHASDARDRFTEVVDQGAAESDIWSSKVLIGALAQLGQMDLVPGKYDAAVTHLEKAVAIGRDFDSVADEPAGGTEQLADSFGLHGAEENNLALAYALDDQPDRAVEAARSAVSRDRFNPIFIDTLAFALQTAGREDQAAAEYERVVEADPSSYVSLNNYAVLTAATGDVTRAQSLLRQAVSIRPDYAQAWANLGALRLRSGSPLAYLHGQADLGHAGKLDHSLRGGSDELVMDRTIYASGIDVSRPVSPDWSYATTATDRAVPFSLFMLLVVLLRMLWVIGLDRVGGSVGEFIVRPRYQRRGRLWAPRPWIIGAGVSVAVVGAGPLLGSPSLPAAAVVLLTSTALVATPLLARRRMAVARNLPPSPGYTWTPALLVAVAGLPLGVGFTPLPVVNDSAGTDRRAVRRAGLVVMVGLAAALVIVALVSSAPWTRTLAAAAITVVASLAIPFVPFDGSSIANRAWNLCLTVGLGAVTLALAFNWL